jgi:DNA-binding YbaB/EbfC family protein
MFDNMNSFVDKIRENAKNLNDDIGSKVFTANSGAGLVEVSINGIGEAVNIDIDDSLMSDKESLQVFLMSAFNEANKMAEQHKTKTQKDMAMSMLKNSNMFNK